MLPKRHATDERIEPPQPDPDRRSPLPWDAICASLPLAAVLFDAAGRPIWANAVALGAAAAATPFALLAEHITEPLSCPDLLQNLRTPIARALAGENVCAERCALTNAGDERATVQLWAAPIRQGDIIAAAIVLWQPTNEADAYTDLTRSEAISRRLVERQEAERRRVARELHDEIGQALTAVKINLQALEHQNLS